VVSPLLANIALNGIESIHSYHLEVMRSNGKTRIYTQRPAIEPTIRYTDDLVVILRPQDNAEEILKKISEFLAARGMNVSEKKTRITKATDGFDFLGWHFKVRQNGKFKSVPSADNHKAFRKKVKAIVNSSNIGATAKAQKLAPVVRGWRNYHKFCDMSGAKESLWFLNHRAWKVFNKEAKQNRYSVTKLIEKAFPKVSSSINGFVNVTGSKSPFDGDIVYWSNRNSKLYTDQTSKALKRQNQSCAACGLKFIGEERVQLHHVDGNHSNWKTINLVAIHESCHDYIHMGK
jgi:RNA-directed DNA polymerase